MWQGIITLQRELISLPIERFYLLGRWYHTTFAPEEGGKVVSLEGRWFYCCDKVEHKGSHWMLDDDVDYSRNMQ